MAFNRVLTRHMAEGATLLWALGIQVAAIAGYLLQLIVTPEQRRRDPDFTLRLASAGVAILDVGARSHGEVLGCLAGTDGLVYQEDDLAEWAFHSSAVLNVLRGLSQEQPQTFRALRPTFSADLIMTSLRRLPWRALGIGLHSGGRLRPPEPPWRGAHTSFKGCETSAWPAGARGHTDALKITAIVAGWLNEVLQMFSGPFSAFSAESAAFRSDLVLQASIIACVEPALRHFGSGSCLGTCNPRLGSCLVPAGQVLNLLSCPMMGDGMLRRAWQEGQPPLVGLMCSMVDHLAALPATEGGGDELSLTNKYLALSGAPSIMWTILGTHRESGAVEGPRPAAGVAAKEVVPYVKRAAAAVTILLGQQACPPLLLHRAVTALSMTSVLPRYGFDVDADGPESLLPGTPLGAALAADFAGGVQAAEACLRLAARLPELRRRLASFARPPDGSLANQVSTRPFLAGILLTNALSSVAVFTPQALAASQAAQDALAGLVESFAKFGHVLAGLDAAGSVPRSEGFQMYCQYCDGVGRLQPLCGKLADVVFVGPIIPTSASQR